MQTFFCEPSAALTAKRLDNKRLGKQRVECKQIYLALTEPTYGWKHHPAVKMWQGHLDALAIYGFLMCGEWKQRGFQDSLAPWFFERFPSGAWSHPSWFDDDRVIRSHRGALLTKDPAHYGQFPWHDATFTGYHWPI